MTFEEILPGLKAKKKYVRTGWGGAENYVQLFDTIEQNGVALEVTPYFLINVSGEGEGFSMWSPTPCDVLAADWVDAYDVYGGQGLLVDQNKYRTKLAQMGMR